jgi:hypothetical protein
MSLSWKVYALAYSDPWNRPTCPLGNPYQYVQWISHEACHNVLMHLIRQSPPYHLILWSSLYSHTHICWIWTPTQKWKNCSIWLIGLNLTSPMLVLVSLMILLPWIAESLPSFSVVKINPLSTTWQFNLWQYIYVQEHQCVVYIQHCNKTLGFFLCGTKRGVTQFMSWGEIKCELELLYLCV